MLDFGMWRRHSQQLHRLLLKVDIFGNTPAVHFFIKGIKVYLQQKSKRQHGTETGETNTNRPILATCLCYPDPLGPVEGMMVSASWMCARAPLLLPFSLQCQPKSCSHCWRLDCFVLSKLSRRPMLLRYQTLSDAACEPSPCCCNARCERKFHSSGGNLADLSLAVPTTKAALIPDTRPECDQCFPHVDHRTHFASRWILLKHLTQVCWPFLLDTVSRLRFSCR